VNELFLDHPGELDEYEKVGILSYETSSSILAGLGDTQKQKMPRRKEGQVSVSSFSEASRNTGIFSDISGDCEGATGDEMSLMILEEERIWQCKQPVMVKASSTKIQHAFLFITSDPFVRSHERMEGEGLEGGRREGKGVMGL
jgi:hypothetical protein